MIDLMPFCSTDPYMWFIAHPFSRGTFTYATNGCIIVRVPRRDGVPDGGVKDPDAVMSKLPTPTIPFPALVIPENIGPCPTCSGRGYKHDCEFCECDCEACSGIGRIRATIIFFDVCFDAKYIKQIQSLPNVLVAKSVGEEAMAFSFDGGIGAVKPLRRREGEVVVAVLT